MIQHLKSKSRSNSLHIRQFHQEIKFEPKLIEIPIFMTCRTKAIPTILKTLKVTCAIIHFGTKILVVQRSETMKPPLKWEFPGGKIEAGESEEDCIKREIFEELNIHIKLKHKLTPITHQYPDFKINLIPFVADYVFLEKDDLETLDWAEADLPVLNNLLHYKW